MGTQIDPLGMELQANQEIPARNLETEARKQQLRIWWAIGDF